MSKEIFMKMFSIKDKDSDNKVMHADIKEQEVCGNGSIPSYYLFCFYNFLVGGPKTDVCLMPHTTCLGFIGC
ncbi:hypothetical protein Hdeb2414_s0007g00253951 [Helianthus debilis subsp. tardiflorus]